MTRAYRMELWLIAHRFCNDDPGVISSLEEAKYVLDLHPEHDCLQHAAAMARASSELAA